MSSGDRARLWPAIEARYGQPISHWLDLMAEHAGRRYPDQIAVLREGHGFSQAHANAVVMYARGSTTSSRHTTLDSYLAEKDRVGAATVRRILGGLLERHAGSSIELAWNHPFLVIDGRRMFSVGVLTHHLLAAPWDVEVLDAFRTRLAKDHALQVNRRTFRLPLDWTVDEALLDAIVTTGLAAQAGSDLAGAD